MPICDSEPRDNQHIGATIHAATLCQTAIKRPSHTVLCVYMYPFTSVSALRYVDYSVTLSVSVCIACRVSATCMCVFRCVFRCLHVSDCLWLHSCCCLDFQFSPCLPVLCVPLSLKHIIYLAKQMGDGRGIPLYSRAPLRPGMTPTGFSITIH